MTTTHTPPDAQTTDIAARMGQAIKRAISNAGITQREAARRTGIPLRTLERRCAGSPLFLDEMIGIAQATGVTATQLMLLAEDDHPEQQPYRYRPSTTRRGDDYPITPGVPVYAVAGRR